MANFILSASTLSARPTRPVAVSELELDENGLPIVNVVLHDKGLKNKVQTFRFILDTGSSLSILDDSVSSCFYYPDAVSAQIKDVVGERRVSAPVFIKRVDLAHIVRDEIPAIRMDIRSQIGPEQDVPVDGILGMSYLGMTRFVLDPIQKRIEWWNLNPDPGVDLPLMYDGAKLPYLHLSLSGKAIACLADTGAMGGLQLPWTMRPSAKGETFVESGLSGLKARGESFDIERLEAGTGAWKGVPVDFSGPGDTGAIGMDVWSAAPVCFDFIANCVTLRCDGKRSLPVVRPGRLSLPVLWDRSGRVPVLKVADIKAGSPMERAGCQVGDEILQAGSLEGKTLTRRSLMALVAKGEPHPWVVRRGGARVTLDFIPGRDWRK